MNKPYVESWGACFSNTMRRITIKPDFFILRIFDGDRPHSLFIVVIQIEI
ncbi:hypothetical protein LDG_6916 [Legionella drancourtii LLAP12]|uniref:Uncharacterized protein n=1 Tax=Legionella drancourtii LLAP12 TaxID=658187 RepID=G9ENT8_9GAMM|nr:hypothetical protein LDG_6916 [Legionella drancourtii LLAP12]